MKKRSPANQAVAIISAFVLMSSVSSHFTVAAFADYSASAETETALSDAQQRYQAALEHIDYLNEQYWDAEAVYNDIQYQIYETEVAIADLQSTIEQRQAELTEAQEVLAERLESNYMAGNLGLLDVLLQSTSFDDFISRLYYANKVADSDTAAIQSVKEIKAALEADQQALYQQEANLELLRAEQEEYMAVLSDMLYEAQVYADSLDDEVQALIAQRDAEIAAAAETARIAAEEEAARQAAQSQQASYEGSESYADSGSGDSGEEDDSNGSSGGSSAYHDSSVVSAAYSYIGTSYSVLDCSGLTSAAYGDCGHSLYHQSGVQYSIVCSKGNLVGADGLVPGDLAFYSALRGF